MAMRPPEAHGAPPAVRLFEVATATWMSQAVSAAAALGIADELTTRPRPVDEIAASVGAHAPTLYRLLRVLADAGLLQELDGQRFTLTDVGDALRSDAPASMRNLAIWTGLPADRDAWTDLVESVRTGEPAFARAHRRPIYDYLRERPDAARVFDGAMTEISGSMIAPFVEAYDFSPFGTVVDVGGGHGALLTAVLASSPRARGVLYDLPAVVDGGGGLLERAGLTERCDRVGGDFFESVPAGGDIYLLSNIIHNWDDERATQILANCRSAMVDGGRVLLAEIVLPDGTEPSPAKLMDLAMLVLTSGGRQRTRDELHDLFRHAELEPARVIPAGLYSFVEAVQA